VLAALLELAPAGVEQVDGDGFVEYALYGAAGELPAFPEGEAEVGGVLVSVRGEEVAEDWAERWKQFHEPVLVGGRLWIRPPWAQSRPGALDLVIDPGQAFGTGAHPTTRLSLELMLGLEPRGSFADLGCGSGVLAIAAALLGFGPITAVDNELAALDATRENATANGVQLDRLERVNLREESPPQAGTVVANLVRPLLLELAPRLERRPGALIVSGLLDEEADEVAAAFAPLSERDRRSAQGWTALLLL
jgi:ribosomal protein L11 methyltransferase